MPPGFLDYLTRIDELIAELIRSNKEHGAILIDKLNELITASTGEEPDVPSRHLPFIAEATLTTAQPTELLIRTDPEQGLEAPARSGYVINDGVGEVWLSIHDGITAWSKELHMYVGEYVGFRREDNIFIDKLKLRTNIIGTVARVILSR